jgi:NitT/TauT family transport system substrate-binding protein
MRRGPFLRTSVTGVALGTLGIRTPAGAASKSLLIAEPQHSIGYLPLYIAIRNNSFVGLNVSTITLGSSGSEHTNAVLTGQAWGFIGGPEHNAYADVKGANLRAICNVVNRNNNYFVAAKGVTPGKDLKAFLRGKRIAVSSYGGTPNSTIRYVLKKFNMDPTKDVTLMEVTTAAIGAAVAQGQADLGVMNEPMITRGVEAGQWGEPFWNGARVFGPYAYSTINVAQQSVTSDPATARAFVAGMRKGLAFVRDRQAETLAMAAKEFPDMTPAELKTSMARAYADQLWEWSGKITPDSVKTAEAVVIAAGLLTAEVPYQAIVDPQFFS